MAPRSVQNPSQRCPATSRYSGSKRADSRINPHMCGQLPHSTPTPRVRVRPLCALVSLWQRWARPWLKPGEPRPHEPAPGKGPGEWRAGAPRRRLPQGCFQEQNPSQGGCGPGLKDLSSHRSGWGPSQRLGVGEHWGGQDQDAWCTKGLWACRDTQSPSSRVHT